MAKVEEIHFDAVLHDSHDEDQIHLAAAGFPAADVRPGDRAARTRARNRSSRTALHKLAEEDPCLRVEHNKELNETVVRGLSDLHLKLMLERMKERYGVEVNTRPPRIAYRETIAGQAEGHHRHKKQTGGAGQFGEVFLRIEPLPRGAGFEFVDEVKGGAIPGQFMPAIEKGVRQVLEHGAIAGYPLQDVRVIVYDGKYHPVDSQGSRVRHRRQEGVPGRDRARRGRSVLEPIVNLEIYVPEQNMGDITGGLAGKRARINGTESHARRRDRDQGAGAAGGTRRLPDRTEGDDRRPRPLRDRVQPLRAGAAAACRRQLDRGVQAEGGGGLTERSR